MFSSMQSGKGEQIFFIVSEHGPAVLMLEVGGLPVERGGPVTQKESLIMMKSLTKTTRYVSLDQPYEFGKLKTFTFEDDRIGSIHQPLINTEKENLK